MQLNELAAGERGKISALNISNSMLKRRLMALGCAEGCELCMKQKGFLGGPCTIETRGQYISIRCSDACKIVVEQND